MTIQSSLNSHPVFADKSLLVQPQKRHAASSESAQTTNRTQGGHNKFLLAIAPLLLSVIPTARAQEGSCTIWDAKPGATTGLQNCEFYKETESSSGLFGCFTTSYLVTTKTTDTDSDTSAQSSHKTYSVNTAYMGEFVKELDSNPGTSIIAITQEAMKCQEKKGSICLPLTANVLIAHGSTYQLTPLSELKLGDKVVIDDALNTSPIINFAHREDHQVAPFAAFSFSKDGQTETTSGSLSHNLPIGIASSTDDTINAVDATFGQVLNLVNQEQKTVYLTTPNGWQPIESAELTEVTGFVAPITQSGLLTIVPSSTDNNNLTSVSATQAQQLLQDSIVTSCYSTLPDNLAKVIHDMRMLPVALEPWVPNLLKAISPEFFAPNPNIDGVGTGYVSDHLSSWAEYFYQDASQESSQEYLLTPRALELN